MQQTTVPTRTRLPGLAVRLSSSIVKGYLRYSPLDKGKYWLRTCFATRFLVVQLDSGPWIRVSGASGFEWSMFAGQSKEHATASLLRRLLQPGMTFLDIGANIGYYALTASMLVGSTGVVHAFEPTPELADRIRYNAHLNGFGNLIVCQVAVSDSDGTAELRVCEDDSEGNSLVSFEQDWKAITVPMTSLDTYIQRNGIDHVDVMKIDCEGSELSALRGGHTLLSSSRSPIIFIELNSDTLRATSTTGAELARYVRQFNYSCYKIEELRSGSYPVYNILVATPAHLDRYNDLLPFCSQEMQFV